MNGTKLIILLLAAALVASNVWWACNALDHGISLTYMGDALDDNKQALAQTLALLPVVARPGVSRAEIEAAARLPGQPDDSFEKDGFLWTGRIGLKFNQQGQLVEAERAWSPP